MMSDKWLAEASGLAPGLGGGSEQNVKLRGNLQQDYNHGLLSLAPVSSQSCASHRLYII